MAQHICACLPPSCVGRDGVQRARWGPQEENTSTEGREEGGGVLVCLFLSKGQGRKAHGKHMKGSLAVSPAPGKGPLLRGFAQAQQGCVLQESRQGWEPEPRWLLQPEILSQARRLCEGQQRSWPRRGGGREPGPHTRKSQRDATPPSAAGQGCGGTRCLHPQPQGRSTARAGCLGATPVLLGEPLDRVQGAAQMKG